MTDKVPSTLIEIDVKLREHLKVYFNTKGNSTRTIEPDLIEFMKKYYDPLLLSAEGDEIKIAAIKKHKFKFTPSRTLILNFYSRFDIIERRYLNTLALFFNQSYSFSSYDPCQYFLDNQKLKANATQPKNK